MCMCIFDRFTFRIREQGTFTLIQCLFLHLRDYVFISITIISTIIAIITVIAIKASVRYFFHQMIAL